MFVSVICSYGMGVYIAIIAIPHAAWRMELSMIIEFLANFSLFFATSAYVVSAAFAMDEHQAESREHKGKNSQLRIE